MAEILCDVSSSPETQSVVDAREKASRAARRQRMAIRRFRMTSEDAGSRTSSSKEAGVNYGTSSVCGRRREMEDAVSSRPDFVSSDRSLHFFGVFDGHGCSHVANSCRERLHELVAEEVKGTGPVGVEDWEGVMERSFARMDSEVALREDAEGCPSCEWRSGKSERVGSTAVAAVVAPDLIVVGNCGDSRAVLLRGGVALALSSDHKPDRPDELERIQAAGGKVIYWEGARVLGVLAMSRAIGDSYLKPYVTADPEVTATRRTDDDECLIIASDGLWDVLSNEMACQVARTCLVKGRSALAALSAGMEGVTGGSDGACMGAAMLLTKLAMTRGSSDNISVVVVDLKRRKRRRRSQTSPDC